MSQHDFNIANQGFPAFRSDLNAALAALATLSSSATAPASPMVYQLWLDTSTTPLTLKLHDGADWVSLIAINAGTNQAVPVLAADALSGNVLHGGTVSDFASTGIDDNATALRLTLSDAETVINESGAAHDTRIEGDNDASLFVAKASTDRIGIGTTAPQDKLHVDGVARATAFSSFTYSLADDTATSLNLGGTYASWCFISSSHASTAQGLFYFKVGSGASISAGIGNAGTLGTGSLAGATATDGDFTIRAHSDNRLYFENRTGAPISFTITLVARHG